VFASFLGLNRFIRFLVGHWTSAFAELTWFMNEFLKERSVHFCFVYLTTVVLVKLEIRLWCFGSKLNLPWLIILIGLLVRFILSFSFDHVFQSVASFFMIVNVWEQIFPFLEIHLLWCSWLVFQRELVYFGYGILMVEHVLPLHYLLWTRILVDFIKALPAVDPKFLLIQIRKPH
jgi:hypothetical protein